MSDAFVHHGALSRGQKKQERLAKLNDRLAAERAKNARLLAENGFRERSSNRFEPTTEGFIKRGIPTVDTPPVPTPSPAPDPAPVQKPVPVNDAAVRRAYHEFHEAKGGERGEALLAYSQAVGITPSWTCGFQSRSQAEKAYEHLNSEQSKIRYGFDADGSIAARANASRCLSNTAQFQERRNHA